jgi:transposase
VTRCEQDVQVQIARELVARCRSLTAKLLAEIGPISRFKTDAQLGQHSGVAPLEAKLRQEPAPPARPRR